MTQPNVLVILSDDQRFDFLPYMPNTRNLIVAPGREFKTVRCNVGLCQPTRVSLLTGQWSKRHHVLDNSFEALANLDHSNTIGAWMTAAGYRTGLIGKYLNGWPAQIPKPGGWDTWIQLTEATGYNPFGYDVCDGTSSTTLDEFQMDYLRGQADTFMAGSQPWFLVLTPTAPHFPFSPDGDDIFGWSDVRWPIVNEVDVSDKPSWISSQRPLPASAFSNLRATARAQLRSGTSLDRAIGVIINGLAPVVLDNTLIIYSSDNGLVYGEHHLPFVGVFKNDAYDPGLRVPLVMRGPGITPGVSVEPVSIAADITATVLAAGGATAQLTSDGVDLHDMIANPGAYTARQILHSKDVATNFGASPPGDGISTLTRKLYRYPSETGTDRFEAYDLDIDPNEWDNWANDSTRIDERNTLEAALDQLLVV